MITTEARKHAHIIAAAPEMLEALKRAYWLMSAQVVGGKNPHLVPCINELESILAKAEGRA